MDQLKRLVNNLEDLISQEKCGEALTLFKSAGNELLGLSVKSKAHQRLFILAAKTHLGNEDLTKTRLLLDRFVEFYPHSANDFEYIALMAKCYIFERKLDASLEFLASLSGSNWNENETGWLDYFKGLSFFWKGDFFLAESLLQKSMVHATSAGDNYLLGCTLYIQGYIAFQRCFFDIAETYYSRALESFRRCGKYKSQGDTLKMLAILAYRTGEYDKAGELLPPAVECYKRTSNKIGLIASDIALARVNMFKGMYAEAAVYFNKSLSAASRYGFIREEALSCEFLGEVSYHQKQYDSALASLKKAEKIALEIAPEGDIAVEVYRRLGDVYLALGRLERAENALAKAHRLCERLSDKYELGSVLRAYGMVAYKKNDQTLASSFFNEAIVTFKLINESFEQARTLQQSAECLELWVPGRSIGEAERLKLLEKAREQAVEASHLFVKIDLLDRAEVCENISRRLEKGMGDHIPHRRFSEIIFDKKWLKEDCIVAATASMEKVIKKVHSLAPSDIPVMVTGETGTGKEIIARAMHNLSSRADGPFLPVNSASLPEAVFESELFGYRKGAFTGAHADHKGLFEKASGGTLFLDEVSELSLGQQAKLLRALQEKSIRRVGESAERPVDVRLISASNSNVRSLVESGLLRTDFYYRISAGIIELKPLRERKEDIIPLFSFYLQKYDCEFQVEEEAVNLMLRHYWPGNVRELINTTEVLVLLGRSSRTIRAKDLPLLIRDFSDSQPRVSDSTSSSEISQDDRSYADMLQEGSDEFRKQLETSLSKYRGNKSAVARDLGIGRSTLYRHLERLGLR